MDTIKLIFKILTVLVIAVELTCAVAEHGNKNYPKEIAHLLWAFIIYIAMR